MARIAKLKVRLLKLNKNFKRSKPKPNGNCNQIEIVGKTPTI